MLHLIVRGQYQCFVRDCNVYIFDVVRDVCLFDDVCLFRDALCLEGFSLFKQANKLFFADQDI